MIFLSSMSTFLTYKESELDEQVTYQKGVDHSPKDGEQCATDDKDRRNVRREEGILWICHS